jgi:glycosyltransferase A (GT-A) superfamily protein (DUF2064 family)
MMPQEHTAIILFTRSAQADAAAKEWLAGVDRSVNESVARAIISKTKKVLSETHLPIFLFTEKKQVGQTFGEKLSNAFEEVFAQGFESVISVGNDCIELSKVDWQEVIESLDKGENVIGPDMRHGAYLIGLRKESFHKSTFANLSWQTEDLIEDLTHYTNGAHLLSSLRDFNDSRDLYKLRKESSWLRRLLRQLITFEHAHNTGGSDFGDDTNSPFGRRGPPTLI